MDYTEQTTKNSINVITDSVYARNGWNIVKKLRVGNPFERVAPLSVRLRWRFYTVKHETYPYSPPEVVYSELGLLHDDSIVSFTTPLFINKLGPNKSDKFIEISMQIFHRYSSIGGPFIPLNNIIRIINTNGYLMNPHTIDPMVVKTLEDINNLDTIIVQDETKHCRVFIHINAITSMLTGEIGLCGSMGPSNIYENLLFREAPLGGNLIDIFDANNEQLVFSNYNSFPRLIKNTISLDKLETDILQNTLLSKAPWYYQEKKIYAITSNTHYANKAINDMIIKQYLEIIQQGGLKYMYSIREVNVKNESGKINTGQNILNECFLYTSTVLEIENLAFFLHGDVIKYNTKIIALLKNSLFSYASNIGGLSENKRDIFRRAQNANRLVFNFTYIDDKSTRVVEPLDGHTTRVGGNDLSILYLIKNGLSRHIDNINKQDGWLKDGSIEISGDFIDYESDYQAASLYLTMLLEDGPVIIKNADLGDDINTASNVIQEWVHRYITIYHLYKTESTFTGDTQAFLFDISHGLILTIYSLAKKFLLQLEQTQKRGMGSFKIIPGLTDKIIDFFSHDSTSKTGSLIANELSKEILLWPSYDEEFRKLIQPSIYFLLHYISSNRTWINTYRNFRDKELKDNPNMKFNETLKLTNNPIPVTFDWNTLSVDIERVITTEQGQRVEKVSYLTREGDYLIELFLRKWVGEFMCACDNVFYSNTKQVLITQKIHFEDIKPKDKRSEDTDMVVE
jgi:hypothetical protein